MGWRKTNGPFRTEVFRPVWMTLNLGAVGLKVFVCEKQINSIKKKKKEERIGIIRKKWKESNSKKKQIWVIHTGKKSASCSEIIFLFFLCELARINGVVHKELKVKREPFLRITHNQDLSNFFLYEWKNLEHWNVIQAYRKNWPESWKVKVSWHFQTWGKKHRKLNYVK